MHENGTDTQTQTEKRKVAFICNHNACRSQMAEAIAKHVAGNVFDCYSAGTTIKSRINPDAVRIVKARYGIDMEQTQYNKTLAEIPAPDIAIFMGCNVSCPMLRAPYTENWGLDDPTGLDDAAFHAVLDVIEDKLNALVQTFTAQPYAD